MPGTKLQSRAATYTPFTSMLAREVSDMRNRFRRLFGEEIGPEMLMTPFTLPFPTAEIAEGKGEFTVSAEIPGLSAKDVRLGFENGVLTIEGEKQEERTEREDKRFLLTERSYGAFQRSFTFPGSVKEDEIKAEFRDGVLTVHLPKTPEAQAHGRSIPITESSK